MKVPLWKSDLRRRLIVPRFVVVLALMAGMLLRVFGPTLASQEQAGTWALPEPVTFTTQEDHKHMLEPLGITQLRPGPGGNESALHAANYDESRANPYPRLPEVLTLANGEPITTIQWAERLLPGK
jgi:hypothetical protein